jgi:histidinol-phosphate aminotransferase
VLAQVQNCRKIEIPFDGEFNLPAFLVSTQAALTIVCNPNAPSGTFIRVEEIAPLVKGLKGVLLVDEAYVDFAEDNCVRLIKDFGNLVILRSMSKGYSLAGIRFGYGIAQRHLIEGLRKVRDSYAVDAAAIAAATAAIKDQNYFRQTIRKVKEERTRLRENLIKLGFSVPESFSNFLLAQCRGCKASEVYDKLVGQNIYVRYFNATGLDDKLRITVGTNEQNGKLIKALEKIVSERG